MNKFSKALVLLLTISLTACGKSSSNTQDNSPTNTDTTPTTSIPPVDYGETYDVFDYLPGEFDQINITKTDELDNSSLFNGYYASLTSWDNGKDLKQKLYNIIYDENTFSPLSYNANWETNQTADESLTDFDRVRVVYNDYDEDKYSTYSQTNTSGWSREHAFCASLLTGSITATAVKTKGIATDFHNLFAASSSGNSSRSDKNFGPVSVSEDISSGSASAKKPGYNYRFTESLFEPNDTDKGQLSRAILYMSVMYGKDSWNTNKYKVGDGVYLRENTCTISNDHCIGGSHTLVNWANTYLVSNYEYKHNEVVSEAQHNRNPFVDFVNLADYVYGNKRNSKGTIADLISSYSYLNMDNSEDTGLAIENLSRQYNVGQKLDLSNLKVYLTKNNLSKTTTSDYQVYLNETLLDETNPYVFKEVDIGEMTIEIVSGTFHGTYKISVNALGINSCNNIHTFDSYITSNKTDSSSRDELRAKKFKVNETNWSVEYVNPTPDEAGLLGAIANDGTYGVKIGSTTKYCDSIVFTSDELINNVDMISFKGATAASTDETIKIELLDEEGNVLHTSSKTINRNNVETSFILDDAVNCKIKITFSNTNHKALYVTAIAFNAING